MMQHYPKRLLLFAMLCLGLYSQGQVNEVLKASQFGGITNVSYNPAIADNRFKVDLNLISIGIGIDNNYLGLSPNAIAHPSAFNDPKFKEIWVAEHLDPGSTKNVFLNAQIQGPLSFLVSWGKDRSNKNAIAISYHTNMVFNVEGVGEEFARAAYYGLGYRANDTTGFNLKNLHNGPFSFQTAVWADFGATYSRVLFDKGAHMIKAGVTGKFVLGLAGAFASSKGFDYKFQNYDTLNIYASHVQYAHSDIITGKDLSFQKFIDSKSQVTFAADLGVVYEWRPDKDKYKYQMDCKDYYRNDVNKYKLAVGFSVIDIGRVRFLKPGNVRNYDADIQNWNVHQEPIKDVASFDSVLFSKPGNFKADNVNDFSVWLPTRFNLFIDYEIYKGLGVHLSGTISPNMAADHNQIHYPTSISLTPRYDHKWVGVYLPLTYTEYNNFGVGAGLRAGPLFITSSNIITVFAQKATFALNIQAGFKISIPQMKPKDKDKDGVSNKKDKCPKEKGPCATHGCPDQDGDGIVDKEDECPTVPGPIETHGCPDRDHDGVYDMNDSCPDVPGLKEFAGCPDTDGDGIIDKDDECPTEKGPKELHGCPDRDGDGVADKYDACPDLPGDKAHKGCPDTDGDGIYDNEDSCPRVKGPIENHGCPWPDTDGDGILDKDDACPKVFGVIENHGCPLLSKKEIETLKYAFDNLEFETAKDKIKPKSFPSLNGLAKLLVEKNYGLKIEGHTDNQGKPEMNMDLSRRRAESVKAYLIDKGVKGSLLETAGYGLTKPIADNKTPAGRQKNRRVEMSIIYPK